LRRRVRRRGAPCAAASSRFSLHASGRRRCPCSRARRRCPARAMSGVSQAGEVVRPRSGCCRWRRRHRPMIVRSVVVLPAPLRPSSSVTPPVGHRRGRRRAGCGTRPMWVCTPDRVSSASAHAGTLGRDAQVGLLHDGRGDAPAAGSPSATSWPLCSTMMRSAQFAHHVHLVLDQQQRSCRVAP
jgi:hypothetical protein